ncbi:hypothetical protein DPMN_101235 [Dreissena polymorpha]|uniref:Uncharacterized protein n=1 Tax=Dreissena polymorpha TaxID=45954 RepID=A0A9D4LH59_DREPO|nr:hypothetical protein DPMN_101235 [Dreissena polymorpha]
MKGRSKKGPKKPVSSEGCVFVLKRTFNSGEPGWRSFSSGETGWRSSVEGGESVVRQ